MSSKPTQDDHHHTQTIRAIYERVAHHHKVAVKKWTVVEMGRDAERVEISGVMVGRKKRRSLNFFHATYTVPLDLAEMAPETKADIEHQLATYALEQRAMAYPWEDLRVWIALAIIAIGIVMLWISDSYALISW